MEQLLEEILENNRKYTRQGKITIRVGLPAKSGVGGGIMADVPTRKGIGIYAPALDGKGNSIAGIHLLEEYSRRMFLSIF